jgi:F-type H+-transporting ATPase subunit b
MEDRTESIKKDLELAKNNVANVENMYKEANDIIAGAKQEASSIREKAYAQAKAEGDSKITALKADLDKKYDQFTGELKEETNSLKAALLDKMPEFKEKVRAKISSI